LYKVTVKNSDNQTVLTEKFDTQQEAFDWAVNKEFEQGNIYDITEDND
jgi:hypothetical protein